MIHKEKKVKCCVFSGPVRLYESQRIAAFTVEEQAFPMEVTIDRKPLTMEIDTGAMVFLISECQQKAMFSNDSQQILSGAKKTYWGVNYHCMGAQGASMLRATDKAPLTHRCCWGWPKPPWEELVGTSIPWLENYGNYVYPGSPGMMLIQQTLRPSWPNMQKFSEMSSEPQAIQSSALSEARRHTKIFQTLICAIVIRKAIELRLGHLEACGILKQVMYSKWVAPIAAILKMVNIGSAETTRSLLTKCSSWIYTHLLILKTSLWHYDLVHYDQLKWLLMHLYLWGRSYHLPCGGTEQPIAFYIIITPCQQVSKLCLARKLVLKFGFNHQYMHERQFTLIINHKPLMTILGSKKGIPSLAGNSQTPAVSNPACCINYKIKFKLRQKHANADGLSYLPLQKNKITE